MWKPLFSGSILVFGGVLLPPFHHCIGFSFFSVDLITTTTVEFPQSHRVCPLVVGLFQGIHQLWVRQGINDGGGQL